MRKTLLTILFSMSSLAMLAREYSGRGVDYDSEPMGLNGMGTALIACLVFAAIGGLLYWALKDKIEDDNSNSCLGCLGILGGIFLVIAGLGVFAVGWSLIMALVITPIFYIVTYIFSLVVKLVLAFFAIMIIPALFYGLVVFLVGRITMNKTILILFTIPALAAGFATDAYLYSLLPSKTITVETFFPKWTLDEQVDMQLHPEKYEEGYDEDDDDDSSDDSYEDDSEEVNEY